MHSDLQHCIKHFQTFYSAERIQSDKNKLGSMFKAFASRVIKNYPEFSRDEKFIREITRIKGALK